MEHYIRVYVFMYAYVVCVSCATLCAVLCVLCVCVGGYPAPCVLASTIYSFTPQTATTINKKLFPCTRTLSRSSINQSSVYGPLHLHCAQRHDCNNNIYNNIYILCYFYSARLCYCTTLHYNTRGYGPVPSN